MDSPNCPRSHTLRRKPVVRQWCQKVYNTYIEPFIRLVVTPVSVEQYKRNGNFCYELTDLLVSV